MPGTLISPREAAGRLGVSLAAMQTMIRNGEIKALRKGRLVKVSEADLQDLLDQKKGRMAGDMTMPEIRSLDEFKENLVQALDDRVVKQALQRCIGGAGLRRQVLDALDSPEVREKLRKIQGRSPTPFRHPGYSRSPRPAGKRGRGRRSTDIPRCPGWASHR